MHIRTRAKPIELLATALFDEEIGCARKSRPSLERRRALPLGGEAPQDYVFERIGDNSMPEKVRMSELFGPHDTLILYSFMYGPERDPPCSGCTHLLDGIHGAARHLTQRAAFHVVAKSPIARLRRVAHASAVWEHMPLISTAGNAYDARLFRRHYEVVKSHALPANRPVGEDWDETIFTVFKKRDGKIRHFWGSEMAFTPPGAGPAPPRRRLADPLWNLLDMTPEGRGGTWFRRWSIRARPPEVEFGYPGSTAFSWVGGLRLFQ